MKTCSICFTAKLESAFYRLPSGSIRGNWCKPCHSAKNVARQRKQRELDPDAFRAAKRAYMSTYKAPVLATIKCCNCSCDVELHTPSHFGRKKFCGRVCSSNWTAKQHPELVGRMRAARTADTEVHRIASLPRGASHPQWIDGRASGQRPAAINSKWRKAVFARDGYTCQGCGQKGGSLQADHIKPYATHPDLRWELENGRTLCVECHKATPTYGAKFGQLLRRERLLMMGKL